MFCKYCGSEIKESSVFCPTCGKKLLNGWNQKKKMCMTVLAISVGAVIMTIILLVQNGINTNHFSFRGKTADSMTMEEQVDEIFDYVLTHSVEESYINDNILVLYEKYKLDPNFYLYVARKNISMEEYEYAKKILLESFKETESTEIMDLYVDTTVKHIDESKGEQYYMLLKLAEALADATDNSEKVEVAKKIYTYASAYN